MFYSIHMDQLFNYGAVVTKGALLGKKNFENWQCHSTSLKYCKHNHFNGSSKVRHGIIYYVL